MVSRMEAIETERVSPQQAVEVLRREGLEVTEIQAKKILEFLEKLANIVVSQCLKDLKDDVL
jgi:protein-tyrosine-phosphatase